MTDAHTKTPMGITAENLAEKYKISREEVDAFALRSQKNWKAAQDKGIFNAEIAPIKVGCRCTLISFPCSSCYSLLNQFLQIRFLH